MYAVIAPVEARARRSWRAPQCRDAVGRTRRRGDVPRADGRRRRERHRRTAELAGARVSARVVGEAKGPKITGFTYKAKARGRRRYGHRQHYTTVEITDISASACGKAAAVPGRKSQEA